MYRYHSDTKVIIMEKIRTTLNLKKETIEKLQKIKEEKGIPWNFVLEKAFEKSDYYDEEKTDP